MSDETIKFGTLHPDGSVTNETELKKDVILKCPNVIIDPSHYLEDGSCRCFDPLTIEMIEWGYKWDDYKGHWD